MSGYSERSRAFIAVRLEPSAEAVVEELIARLRKEQPGISCTKPGNLHITLRFLGGAVAPEMLNALRAQLRPIAGQYSPFELCVEGLGAFSNRNQPRVIWIGIKSAPLSELAASIEAAAQDCGFAPESRPFTPHLAIARIRPGQRASLPSHLRDRQQVAFGRSTVDVFALYRSTLGSQGPDYTILESYRLKKRAA